MAARSIGKKDSVSEAAVASLTLLKVKLNNNLVGSHTSNDEMVSQINNVESRTVVLFELN